MVRAQPHAGCVVCGIENPQGLRVAYQRERDGTMTAAWTPSCELEGFLGIVHGGIIATVLDEAMSKAVAAIPCEALTCELRVRYRRHVPSGETVWIRGWVVERNRRKITAEASLSTAAGQERAHAWAVFLTPP